MPAIMTHDFFGRETLARNARAIGFRIDWDPVTETPVAPKDAREDGSPACAAAHRDANAATDAASRPDDDSSAATDPAHTDAPEPLPFVTDTERESAFAFLLGNQGPDPFFYTFLSPWTAPSGRLGSLMHREHAAKQLTAFKEAAQRAANSMQNIVQAYVHGFLCHYALDRTMHPFIYAQQFALCDVGVGGLSRRNNHEVHALIESDLDEMVLYTETGETIAGYRPTDHILRAAPKTLAAISPLFSQVTHDVWHKDVALGLFATAVRDFRVGQHGLHSPTGRKRAVMGAIEETVRPYSFLRAMSLRPVEADTCAFDNRDHAKWRNPFINESSTEDFWDLLARASAYADDLIEAFDQPSFGLKTAQRLTCNLNFSGDPVG